MIRFICALSVFLLLLLWLSAPSTGQTIVVSLDAVAGDLAADPHAFGVYNDALPAADPYDLPEPPNPPADYLSLAFAMPGYAGPLHNRWREEFKPTLSMEDEFEDWVLYLDTDRVGGMATLSFAAVVGVDLPLGVVVTPANGRPRRGSLPSEFIVSLDSPHIEVVVTLIWEDPTTSSDSTWGEVKSSYAPTHISDRP